MAKRVTDVELAWHFVSTMNGRPVLRDGRPVPPIGRWLNHEGYIRMCEAGLHASTYALDALDHVMWPDAIACLVEVDQIMERVPDKLVCRRRRVLGMVPADDILANLARDAVITALDEAYVLPPPAALDLYLRTLDPEAEIAAYGASYDALRMASTPAIEYAFRAACALTNRRGSFDGPAWGPNAAITFGHVIDSLARARLAREGLCECDHIYPTQKAVASDINDALESALLTEMGL